MLFVARDVLERRRGREFVDNQQVTERRGVFVRQVLEHDDGRGCPARGRGKGCQQGQEAQRRGLARRRYQREVGQPRWLQVLVGRSRKMKDSDASSSHTPLATDAAFMMLSQMHVHSRTWPTVHTKDTSLLSEREEGRRRRVIYNQQVTEGR